MNNDSLDTKMTSTRTYSAKQNLKFKFLKQNRAHV